MRLVSWLISLFDTISVTSEERRTRESRLIPDCAPVACEAQRCEVSASLDFTNSRGDRLQPEITQHTTIHCCQLRFRGCAFNLKGPLSWSVNEAPRARF